MAEPACSATPRAASPEVSCASLVRLRCPACGRTRQLARAADWPADLWQIVALCPRCEGHGHDSALLMYADGRIAAEHPVP